MPDSDKILIIKLSALGDFVQSFGAMRAIRLHHPNSDIALLTTKTYASLAKKSGYFDNIIIDKRPKLFQFKSWLNLAKKLNTGKIF